MTKTITLTHPAISPRILQGIIRKIPHNSLVKLAKTSKFAKDAVSVCGKTKLARYQEAKKIQKSSITLYHQLHASYDEKPSKEQLEEVQKTLTRFLKNVNHLHLSTEQIMYYHETVRCIKKYLDVYDFIHNEAEVCKV